MERQYTKKVGIADDIYTVEDFADAVSFGSFIYSDGNVVNNEYFIYGYI